MTGQAHHSRALSGYGASGMYNQHVTKNGYEASGISAIGFETGPRHRLNALPICLNTFIPWLLFTGLYAVLSFSVHYDTPVVTSWITAVAGVLVGVAALLAVRAFANRANRDPSWHIFAFMALLVAYILAIAFGDLNFRYNMQPYYDVKVLSSYPSVNPARDKGQQMMDAGRIYFERGSRIDMSKAMSFKNIDVYCVAPVISGDLPLLSYDFWAVGLNCCSQGQASDFRCGEYSNPVARSGLRLMQDDQRAFFRLAVQQAESMYTIRATHPLFFYWTQDPVEEINSYRDNGFKYYLLGVFAHFAFNIVCVSCAVMGFSKVNV